MELNLITANDSLRPIMTYVKVTKTECVATNAHVLGVIPTNEIFDDGFINDIPDDGMLIHSDDWKKLKNNVGIQWKNKDVIKIHYKGKKRDVLIESIKESDIGTYPNWKAVMPKDFDDVSDVSKIGINFKLGLDIQKAIGANCGLKLSFHNNGNIMTCKPIKVETKAYGLIMPISIHN